MLEFFRPAVRMFYRRSRAAKQGCLLVAAALFLSSEYAHPQGMVQFYNYIPGSLVTHIYAPNSADINSHQIGNGPTDTPIGSTDWSAFVPIGANGTAGPFGASTTFAQLLAAPGFDQTEAGLQPALPITTFHTGNGAGVLIGMTATLNNVPWFFQSTIEVVVWDNSSGLYPTWTTASAAWESGLIAAGNSGPLNVQLYGPSPPPASLIGLQSFNLYYNIPEPSSLALGTLGLISVGMFSRLASLKVPPKRLKDSNLRKG